MSEVELRLTANVDEATRGIGRFRKEYRELVQQVEKPLRQVNAFRDLETSLENTSRELRSARDRVRELATALASTASPSRAMQTEYRDAVNELRTLERAESSLTSQIGRRREELRAAGVDTRNLTAEQVRLANELRSALEAGQADAAMRSARSALGVGSIEAAQRELLALREQYRLVTRDGTLSAKERAEAEATYRRAVSETLERLRTQREAIRQATAAGESEAAAAARRHEAARQSLARLIAEQRQAAIAARQTALEQARNDLGVNRYRALQAEVGRTRQQYELLRRSGNLTTRELALAQRTMTQRVRETQRAIRELNTEQRSMSSLPMLGGIGAVGGGYMAIRALRGVASISDAWVELNDRMRLAASTQQDYENGMRRLEEISDRTYTSMTNNAEVYINALGPLRERGFTDTEALQFVEAIGLGLVASAAKGEKAAATINQLSNALQDGALRGDAFNSVIRNTPAIADALARGLNVTREQLAAMAKEGELTTSRWVHALLSQVDSLGRAVDGMAVTTEDALVRLNNAWTKSIGEADMSPLINAIEGLRDTISDPVVMENLVALASALVSIAGAAVQGGSEFVDLGKRIGYMMAAATGSVTELDKVEQRLKDIDRALTNTGMSRTLDSFIYSKEELEAEANALRAYRDLLLNVQTGTTTELRQEAERAAAERDELRRQEAEAQRQYIELLKTQQAQQLENLKAYLREKQREETKALKGIEDVKKKRLDIEKFYTNALASLASGGRDEASYGRAQQLKVAAQQALARRDFEAAQANARAAVQMLQELAEAGENTYGFEGFIKQLRGIELAANDIERTDAEQKLQAIRDEIEATKGKAADLKDMQVSFDLDEAQLERIRQQIVALAESMKKELTLPVTLTSPGGAVDVTDISNRLNGPIPGFSRGGWTGPGSKYQIAGFVHADEYVQPKHRMREPGALEFMERFRRYGMAALRGYAEGGLVSNIARHIPYLPPVPAPAAAGAGGTPVHLHMDGQSYEMRATQDVVDALHRAVRVKKLRKR